MTQESCWRSFGSTKRTATYDISSIRAAGYYYVVSAGHCGDRLPVTLGTVSGYSPGRSESNGLYDAATNGFTHCDCQGIGAISAGRATNGVYISDVDADYHTRVAARTETVLGSEVCMSGASTNAVVCGPITVEVKIRRQPSAGADSGQCRDSTAVARVLLVDLKRPLGSRRLVHSGG